MNLNWDMHIVSNVSRTLNKSGVCQQVSVKFPNLKFHKKCVKWKSLW